MIRRLVWRPEVAFFLVCFFAVSVRFRDRAFNDPGALWHVKVGERILSEGFMTTDPFTFTFSGHTWIPQQWGGEIAMAAAHAVSGFDGMLLSFSVLVATLFTWLFSRAVRDGMHPILAGIVVGGAAVVSAFHFYVRPHMFTMVGMAITMAIIVDFSRGRAGPWHLWALIPLFAVWTNIHGGVLGGTVTLGMAVCIWLYRSPVSGTRTKLFLLAVLAACALTPFVNPFGMEMLRTWQKIVGSPVMAELVSEHQPLSLSHTAGQVVVGFAAFYGFVLFGVKLHEWRWEWLLPAVWFLLTLKGIRQGPLFAVTAVVVIADIWQHTRWYALIKKHGDTLATEPGETRREWSWLSGPVAVFLLGFGLQLAEVHTPILGRGWAKLDERAWPVELGGPLQQYAASVPTGTPIFNDANLGGFVLYYAPSLKIFMDDRFELYSDDWIQQYAHVVYTEPGQFQEWTKQYRFEFALLAVEPKQTKLEEFLANSVEWVEVARCDRGVIFRRR